MVSLVFNMEIITTVVLVSSLLFINVTTGNGLVSANDRILEKRSSDYLSRMSKALEKNLGRNERLSLERALRDFNSRSQFSTLLSTLSKEKQQSHLLSAGEDEPLKDYATCRKDLTTYISAVQQNLTWALQMVDASGKPGAGIMRQNLRFLGDFDECVSTKTSQTFGPEFCFTTILIRKINQLNLTDAYLQIGLCLPDSCDELSIQQELQQYFDTTLGNKSVIVAKVTCQEKDLPISTNANVAIVVLSVIAALVVLGTAYDLLHVQGVFTSMCYSSDDDPLVSSASLKMRAHDSVHRSEYEPLINKYTDPTQSQGLFGRLLMSFSLYTNTSKLLSTSSASGNIDCINGIRFFSMTWVVLGHSIIYGLSTMDNIYSYLDMSYGRWTFQVISNALVSVDTFFALSGLLLVYLILKQLQKTGPTPDFFGQMYFHRFWRLTPPYMLVLMTYVTLFKYVSDGPEWPQDGPEVNDCEDTWWTNLLYINNFVKADEMCMGWSWYLANDMQFFIISPLIFLPFFYLGIFGLAVPFAFLIGTCLAAGIITFQNDLPPNLDFFSAGTNDYFKLYYIKPYTRLGPYLVGMVTGYFLYRYDCKARLPKVCVVLGWMLAAAVALAVQYGLFEHTNGHPVTSEVAALYNSLHRTAWAVAVCWVIYACANGYGGFVNTILSWKALVPLSRLTYCVYLVHPIVITFHFASQRRSVYLDNNNVAFSFVGILVISYLVGYVASMAFEAPMIGLEKAFKKPKSSS